METPYSFGFSSSAQVDWLYGSCIEMPHTHTHEGHSIEALMKTQYEYGKPMRTHENPMDPPCFK